MRYLYWAMDGEREGGEEDYEEGDGDGNEHDCEGQVEHGMIWGKGGKVKSTVIFSLCPLTS